MLESIINNAYVSIQLLRYQEKSRLHGKGEAVECRPSADKESIAQSPADVKGVGEKNDAMGGESEREVARNIQLRIAADHGDQQPDVIGHGSVIGRPIFDGSHRNLNHGAE